MIWNQHCVNKQYRYRVQQTYVFNKHTHLYNTPTMKVQKIVYSKFDYDVSNKYDCRLKLKAVYIAYTLSR